MENVYSKHCDSCPLKGKAYHYNPSGHKKVDILFVLDYPNYFTCDSKAFASTFDKNLMALENLIGNTVSEAVSRVRVIYDKGFAPDVSYDFVHTVSCCLDDVDDVKIPRCYLIEARISKQMCIGQSDISLS